MCLYVDSTRLPLGQFLEFLEDVHEPSH
jgi:hypothetical protein